MKVVVLTVKVRVDAPASHKHGGEPLRQWAAEYVRQALKEKNNVSHVLFLTNEVIEGS